MTSQRWLAEQRPHLLADRGANLLSKLVVGEGLAGGQDLGAGLGLPLDGGLDPEAVIATGEHDGQLELGAVDLRRVDVVRAVVALL